MHSSARRAKGGIVPPPDWAAFLLNASFHSHAERNEWARDLLLREAGFAGLAQSALCSEWHGGYPGTNPDAEALLHGLGTGSLLRLAARLSMTRWFQKHLPQKVSARDRDRVLATALLTAALTEGFAGAVSGSVRVEAGICGLMTMAADWLAPGETGNVSRGDTRRLSRMLSSWALEVDNLPDWQWAKALKPVARDMLSDRFTGVDTIVDALDRALPGTGMIPQDWAEVVAALPWMMLADWVHITPPQGWPVGVTAVARRLHRRLKAFSGDGLPVPLLRCLPRGMDRPGSPADCARRILRFTAAFLPGLVVGVAWSGDENDPGSSWWRLNSDSSRPLPQCVACQAWNDVADEPVDMRLPKEVFPARGMARVFPLRGHEQSGGWIVVARRNGKNLSPTQSALFEALAARMSGAVKAHGWKERYRAESSKNHLLKRELLLADERLSRAMEAGRILERAVAFQEMLPGVFHNLKNKLTPVMGYAQMLRTRIHDEFADKRLEKIENGADSLAQLLGRLRRHCGPVVYPLVPGNINRVIRRVRSRLEEAARQSRVRLDWDLDAGLEEFPMAEGQLETLVEELVGNAFRSLDGADQADPVVLVRTRQLDSGACELRVRDNGPGISSENIDRIWAPFWSSFPDGDGLGLSVADQILQRHGASCQVESRPRDFTEFVCVFPGVQPQDDVQAATEPQRLSGRVLILDDEIYMLELMRDLLQELGELDIHVTTSGTRALRWLREQVYDLVIADIYLPDVNGLDIYRTLNERKMSDRLILISAEPAGEDVREFLESRQIVFLEKPLELILFKEKVTEKLSQKEA